MTREEQIREAAIHYDDTFCAGGIRDAFIEGAEWADANQPNPWISVEDKLPEPEKEVIVLAKDKYIDIDQLADNGEGGYYWWKNERVIFCEEDKITHWMPIPKLQEE